MSYSQHQQKLRHLFLTEKLSAVQVTGFVEREGSQLAFRPMQWWLYVKFESAHLRCEAVNQWFLQLDIVERIVPQFEVEA